MYIRFATSHWRGDSRAHLGFFHAACDGRDRDGANDFRVQELDRVIDGFDPRMTVPEVLSRRGGRHGKRRGICWFHDTATFHVTQGHFAAWLLADTGLPVRELRDPNPGTCIWQDAHQIVVIPERRGRRSR